LPLSWKAPASKASPPRAVALGSSSGMLAGSVGR
jgi:hypothetical protein